VDEAFETSFWDYSDHQVSEKPLLRIRVRLQALSASNPYDFSTRKNSPVDAFTAILSFASLRLVP